MYGINAGLEGKMGNTYAAVFCITIVAYLESLIGRKIFSNLMILRLLKALSNTSSISNLLKRRINYKVSSNHVFKRLEL